MAHHAPKNTTGHLRSAFMRRGIGINKITGRFLSALVIMYAFLYFDILGGFAVSDRVNIQEASKAMQALPMSKASDSVAPDSRNFLDLEEANQELPPSLPQTEQSNQQIVSATTRDDASSVSAGPVTSQALLHEKDAQTSLNASSGMPVNTSGSEELRRNYRASFIEELNSSDDLVMKTAGAVLAHKQKHGDCKIDVHKEADPWNKLDGVRRDIAVCMVLKNEARILDEYIAFHWLQGVSKFVIYDDASQDNPWSVLEKYVALGIVEYHNMTGHPNPSSSKLQITSLNTCSKSLRQRAEEEGLRWIAFIDADEFALSSVPNESLSETLNKNYRGEACLAIHRTWYGSSFQHKKPSGLVIETYLMASSDYGGGIWNGKLIANINPEGKAINATTLSTVHSFRKEDNVSCKSQTTIRDVRVNHYLRSLEEYSTKAYHNHNKPQLEETPFERFFRRDFNLVSSPIAADYACRVHALLQQIEDMKTTGKIPAAERPGPWNGTYT
ncbi:methyltransferase family [Nannochloropsis gaditana]|uniref:Methyltransferase family n=1 Tax=Nannochloropsis gaditana TaxID=72520 RepID=W7U0X9_9STRA|nr:methyltransferase family [Nannochloropsis gaditana]